MNSIMSNLPDFATLLRIEQNQSSGTSPFTDTQTTTILIAKDSSNSADFAFNSLLQNFSKQRNSVPTLLITTLNPYSHYSACAAKSGVNLRTTDKGGNIQVLNILDPLIYSNNSKTREVITELILSSVSKLLQECKSKSKLNDGNSYSYTPVAIMIDDFSVLLSLGFDRSRVFTLISQISNFMNTHVSNLSCNSSNYLVLQTLFQNSYEISSINNLVYNLVDQCDLYISIQPLKTGYSERVDGIVELTDNRLFADNCVGGNKSFYYKLNDRRVKLLAHALAD